MKSPLTPARDARARCPRCGGFLYDDRHALAAQPEAACLSCGWRATREPDADDMRLLRRPYAGTHRDGGGVLR